MMAVARAQGRWERVPPVRLLPGLGLAGALVQLQQGQPKAR